LVKPHYLITGSKDGRPTYPLPTLLRIHLMQQWYSLSNPAMEDALIDVSASGIQLIPLEPRPLRYCR
jgi:IS5 family transposase